MYVIKKGKKYVSKSSVTGFTTSLQKAFIYKTKREAEYNVIPGHKETVVRVELKEIK